MFYQTVLFFGEMCLQPGYVVKLIIKLNKKILKNNLKICRKITVYLLSLMGFCTGLGLRVYFALVVFLCFLNSPFLQSQTWIDFELN
jgi:hypothetical protein